MATGDKADFYEAVYAVVREIPRGRVTSYGAIARCLGAAGAARTVGYALTASNRAGATDIPAHRVVNRVGQLTGKGHFPPPGMQAMLEAEGVDVVEDRVVRFAELFWEPAEALRLE